MSGVWLNSTAEQTFDFHNHFLRSACDESFHYLLDVFAGGSTMLEAKEQAYTFERLADRPEYQRRDARLARMDDQGLAAALLYDQLFLRRGVEPADHGAVRPTR
jgi:hypothetical protein